MSGPSDTCVGKTAYGTRQQAERVAAPMRQGGRQVRAYPCLKCRNWHVGGGWSMSALEPYVAPTPEECAARAADPAWRAEMQRRREESEARFRARREEIGLPLIRKKAGERF